MTKIIYSYFLDSVCKIIIDRKKMDELDRARAFVMKSEWQTNVHVPIDKMIVWDRTKKTEEWDAFVMVTKDGRCYPCHEFYEGNKSFTSWDTLGDIDDVFVDDYLTECVATNNDAVIDLDYFYKKAPKKDIDIVKRKAMFKKMEAGEQ